MLTLGEIPGQLEALNPGVYRCSPSKSGQADGIRVECDGAPGHAFIYGPRNERRILVSLSDFGPGHDEVWAGNTLADVERFLRRWAFPSPWTRPGPVDKGAERKRIARVLQGIDERVGATPVVVSSEATDSAGQRVDTLDGTKLVRNFPWDKLGRLELGVTVVLGLLGDVPRTATERTQCLVASGPKRRRDPQQIVVGLDELIVANQDHRWDELPWLWTKEEAPIHECRLDADQSAALDRMDEGYLEEVLANYGVTLSTDMHRLLGGQRIVPQACCAHADAEWTDLLVDTIRQAAPWKLVPAIRAEARRRNPTQKRSRKPVLVKLATFPKQSHARKACLMLGTFDQGETAQLLFDATATNVRLHREAWQRPLALEVGRLGIGPEAVSRAQAR